MLCQDARAQLMWAVCSFPGLCSSSKIHCCWFCPIPRYKSAFKITKYPKGAKQHSYVILFLSAQMIGNYFQFDGSISPVSLQSPSVHGRSIHGSSKETKIQRSQIKWQPVGNSRTVLSQRTCWITSDRDTWGFSNSYRKRTYLSSLP